MSKTIAVIYTGGTIGMDISQQGLVPSKQFEGKFFQYLPEYRHHTDVQFRFVEYPTPIDSAQASLHIAVDIHRDLLAQADEVDAFLVLTGSDTLCYIAAALAYLCVHFPLPVVVTGSMQPLIASSSDAPANLRCAIATLSQQARGVQVVFGAHAIPAVRCTKLYTHTAEAMINTGAHSKQPSALPSSLTQLDTPTDFIDRDIRLLRTLPSMHPGFAAQCLAGKPEAILLQCYGNGTAPAVDSALGQALLAAAHKGVPIFAISQSLSSAVDFSIYSSSSWLEDLGVVSCADMSLEASYCKLWFLLNHGFTGAQLASLMRQNLCGELTPPP